MECNMIDEQEYAQFNIYNEIQNQFTNHQLDYRFCAFLLDHLEKYRYNTISHYYQFQDEILTFALETINHQPVLSLTNQNILPLSTQLLYLDYYYNQNILATITLFNNELYLEKLSFNPESYQLIIIPPQYTKKLLNHNFLAKMHSAPIQNIYKVFAKYEVINQVNNSFEFPDLYQDLQSTIITYEISSLHRTYKKNN